MSNEIKITLGVAYANGALSDSVAAATLNVNQTTLQFHGTVASVGTSEEDLTTGDIATLGYLYMKNLDAANYVQWGPKSGGAMVVFGRLKPGESAILRLEPGITLRWIANTAAVKVLTKIYND